MSVALRGLSLVAVSGGYSLLRYAVFSLWWPLPVQSTDSEVCVVMATVEYAGFSSCSTRAQ